MNDAVLAPVGSKQGMTSLLNLNSVSPSAYAPDPSHAPETDGDVSVAGVMLLSAMSVLMAIAGMVGFALFVIGCWWLVSHIPVPAGLHVLLAKLHLARR